MPPFAPIPVHVVNVLAPEVAASVWSSRGGGIKAQMKDFVESCLTTIWQADKPQDYFDALGANAGVACAQHAAAVVFLAAVGAAVDPAVLAMVKPFTANPDGTVTVTES